MFCVLLTFYYTKFFAKVHDLLQFLSEAYFSHWSYLQTIFKQSGYCPNQHMITCLVLNSSVWCSAVYLQ